MKCFRFCLFLMGIGCAPCFGQTPQMRPNIIVMMADDMGMGDSSAYQDFTHNSDSQQVATPAMQRLANMGVRFTDAHTPSSRCSPTRYGLLTGRYPWRNRLKHWVLFGVQGDPMIEKDRPTIATLLQEHDYRTAMFGKWHVGLRYRTTSGAPADAWNDADLTQPLFDSPVDHGFDLARFTSRSHGTSGPTSGSNKTSGANKKRNGPKQAVGPGHIHNRLAVGATGNGKELVSDGPNAYVLSELGGRHLRHSLQFLDQHTRQTETSGRPFFLYYPSNSNHGPHTPDEAIESVPVAGAARDMQGQPMNVRSDYIYENDVVLGLLLDFLETTDDPRRPGHPLIENTIVVFTSDNGAEIKSKTATGPFRSNKGSVYEGGHRVPFLVAWPLGGVGDGKANTPGRSDSSLVCLQDLYATFLEVLGSDTPDYRSGEKGAEDSFSVLPAWQGRSLDARPVFFNDHSEADDPAACALRMDDPEINGRIVSGKWKLFFNARLIREGIAEPTELYELTTDQMEQVNLINADEHEALVQTLTELALKHRCSGGHRLVSLVSSSRYTLAWHGALQDSTTQGMDVRSLFSDAKVSSVQVTVKDDQRDVANVTLSAVKRDGSPADGFAVNARGLGVSGGRFEQVDDAEALLIQFDRDVVVESVSIVAGNGVCGGFYRVGDRSPLAIYCVDADLDAKDQSGRLSDIGIVRRGEVLRLDSRSHFDVESPGQWRLRDLTIRLLEKNDG